MRWWEKKYGLLQDGKKSRATEVRAEGYDVRVTNAQLVSGGVEWML